MSEKKELTPDELNSLKKFEVKMRSDGMGGLEKAIFIDDELLANAGEELSKFMDMIIKDDEPPTETNEE